LATQLTFFSISNTASSQPTGGENSLVREVGKSPMAVFEPVTGSIHVALAKSDAVMADSLIVTGCLLVK
jgi:hypothetical protein